MKLPPCSQQLGAMASSAAVLDIWQRGLFADPAARYHFLSIGESLRWEACEGCFFEGRWTANGQEPAMLAVDGSRVWTDIECATVVVDIQSFSFTTSNKEALQLSVSFSGNMPAELPVYQKSGRAELDAVLLALRFSVQPGISCSDYLGFLTGLQRERRWYCRAAGAAADIWRLIWSTLDEFGNFAVHLGMPEAPLEHAFGVWKFIKIAAHQTKAQQGELPVDVQRLVWVNECGTCSLARQPTGMNGPSRFEWLRMQRL